MNHRSDYPNLNVMQDSIAVKKGRQFGRHFNLLRKIKNINVKYLD